MFLLAAALACASSAPTGGGLYSTPAVRALVDSVAFANRAPPRGLAGYTARVEAEVALLRADGAGMPRTLSVQQVAERVSWQRTGAYAEHVVGHRTQASSVLTYDALSLPSFTVPSVFGNRFALLLGPYADGGGRTVQELHPFARDREEVYAYSGGDTVQRLTLAGRAVTVVKIAVNVRCTPSERTTVFRGEVLVEPRRYQIIALRGEVLELGGRRSTLQRLGGALLQTVGTLEVINAEVDGAFWLPERERLRLRAGSPMAGPGGLEIRVTSRFFDRQVARADTTEDEGPMREPTAFSRGLTLASPDSLRAFGDWREPLGQGTGQVAFPTITSGADPMPRGGERRAVVRPGVREFRDALRFNRVEGWYTGVGAQLELPRNPDLVRASANVGYAWRGHAVRGGGRIETRLGGNDLAVAAGSTVMTTSAFAYAADRGSVWRAAVRSHDDNDYVLRKTYEVVGARDWRLGAVRASLGLARVEDRGLVMVVSSGLLGSDSGFRPNAPVSEGAYARTRATLEIHPQVLAEYSQPGVGVTLEAEAASGSVAYRRVTARISARQHLGSKISVGARLDVGTVVAPDSFPMQQLLGVGGPDLLPGFAYRELLGDRAAVGHISATWALPWGETGERAGTRFVPHLAASVHAGMAQQSSAGVRRAAERVREATAPAGGLSDEKQVGLKASLRAGLTFLNGGLFVGWVRPAVLSGRWRFAVSSRI